MTRKKLTFFSLALLIAIGLNWPIAWYFTLYAPAPGKDWFPSTALMRSLWNERVPDGANDPVVDMAELNDFIGYRRLHLQGGDVFATSLQDSHVRNAKFMWSGFPFESMTAVHVWAPDQSQVFGGIRIQPREISPGGGNYGWVEMLPSTPLLPGFIYNTLVYFILMISPFVAIPAIVALVRRLTPVEGTCPRCGYDMRATDGCPECGWQRK